MPPWAVALSESPAKNAQCTRQSCQPCASSPTPDSKCLLPGLSCLTLLPSCRDPRRNGLSEGHGKPYKVYKAGLLAFGGCSRHVALEVECLCRPDKLLEGSAQNKGAAAKFQQVSLCFSRPPSQAATATSSATFSYRTSSRCKRPGRC